MLRNTLLIAVFACIAALTPQVPAVARVASAQDAIVVVSEEPRNEFPSGVTFAISFTAPSAVKEARLRYELAPDGTGATAVADCTGAPTANCTFTLTSGRGIFIIPGAQITYHWEVTDTSGDKLSTPQRVYQHADTRFTFKTIEEANITLYYHSGTETDARAVLQAAADTIARIGALEKTEITYPLKVYLYATATEMQPAIAPGGVGRGLQVLGEVVYSDTAMVSADVTPLDITRHEVAHIVTGRATKGPFGIESWLNEGISVYAQSRPLASHASALRSAIESDGALSIKELNSSSSGRASDTAGLFYGEAGSIVKFLVESYGDEKFAALLKTFKEGSTADKAFQAVYGFDENGLDNAWRASVGLPAQSASATSPTAQATKQGSVATPGARPTAAAGASSSGGTSSVAIVIIVALAVLVLAGAAAALAVLRRRV